MRIISESRLRRFWESRIGDAAIAQRDLLAWRTVTRHADWANFAGLRRTFGSADLVGNCTVFDVGNNRSRLIGRVDFAKGIVYILRIMDHQEYDRAPWAEDCGCHRPPPKRGASPKGSTAPKRPASHRRKGGERP